MRFLSLLVLTFIYSVSNAQIRKNVHSPERTTQKIELSVESSKLYKTALQTAIEDGWTITNSDGTSLTFSATTPKTFKRWNDDVSIYVREDGELSTLVVKSKLGHDPNMEFIKAYIEKVSSKL